MVVRCDLNVPLKAATITDDGRIRASVGTIQELLDAGAKVVAISHLGRPDGKPDAKYSLAPVGERLGRAARRAVAFSPRHGRRRGDAAIASLGGSGVVLLENLRFDRARPVG